MDKRSILTGVFEEAGLPLSDRQTEQFLIYARDLSDWNQKMNLTAITEFSEIVQKHFLDSSAVCLPGICDVSRETWGGRLIDVGSGAGFPGLPLKILHPECSVTLLDSLSRRVSFLETVLSDCSLTDAVTVPVRAEEAGRCFSLREQFDLCVSRAVAGLSTLCEYCLPFLRVGGLFFAYKSVRLEKELADARAAIETLGGEVEDLCSFTLPGTDLNRTLLQIRKVRPTPERYPRRVGIPAKRPL